MIKKSFQKQRYFLLLFVFFIITTLCSTNRRKKQKAKNQICACKMRGKIIGGTETKKHEFPWHVGLFHEKTDLTYCGGVLLTHLYVMTAAHCIQYSCEDIDIILGGHSIDHTSPEIKRIKTEKCIKHPKYNSPAMLNDIGLIKLAEYVVHDEKMSPVCFPRVGTNYTGRTATAIGWGSTNTDDVDEFPTVLLKTNLTIADFNKCVVRYGEFQVDPSLICSTWNDEGKGAFVADSGGALMIFDKRKKHYVIGLTSRGFGGNKEEADFFTRVDRYYEWIEEYTGKGELCTGYKA